jgi:hypothetical protein
MMPIWEWRTCAQQPQQDIFFFLKTVGGSCFQGRTQANKKKNDENMVFMLSAIFFFFLLLRQSIKAISFRKIPDKGTKKGRTLRTKKEHGLKTLNRAPSIVQD